MVTEFERQQIIDEEHLKLLPIGYWVMAGFLGLYALFMLAYFGLLGTMFATFPQQGMEGPPPQFGWLFLGFGFLVFMFMAVGVWLKVMAGFWITRRRRRVGILIAAALTCVEIPFGTVLGVWTLVTMTRPGVKALFASPDATGLAPQPVAPTVDQDTWFPQAAPPAE
jgi:hypothetical protein